MKIPANLNPNALQEFEWDGSVLGEFNPDQAEAIEKGIRYKSYEEIEPLGFNSATLGIPNREGAQAAYLIAERLQTLVGTKKIDLLETIIAEISQRAFEELVKHYGLSIDETEVLFDDNGTMALYQLLPLFGLAPEDRILTFFDTGRVMPQALSGTNPEFLPLNFKPAVDIWKNLQAVKSSHRNIGPHRVHLVQHFTDHYRSDEEILNEIKEYIKTQKPRVIILPTVTRLGRRLPFISFCFELRKAGFDGYLLLDDCQGLSRLERSRYLKEDGLSTPPQSIWDYCDGVVLTGAKVTGALMGTGAVLLSAQSFEAKQTPFSASALLYRARQYSFMTTSPERLVEYNKVAPRYVQTPELASLSITLQNMPQTDVVFQMLRSIRELILERFRSMEQIEVLEPQGGHVHFIDSIVAFYLKDLPQGGKILKEQLAQARIGNHPEYDVLPITLPALVSDTDRDYLRISLDPRRVLSDPFYLAKIEYTLGQIEQLVTQLP